MTIKPRKATLLLLLLAPLAVGAADLFKAKQATPDYLPVDEAFEIQPLEVRGDKLVLGWRIAKDYYLYRHRLTFALTEPAGGKLGEPVIPAGEKHMDAHFGETEIYRDLLEVSFPRPAGGAPVAVKVGYQGCADRGLCYPPQTRTLDTR